MTKIRYLDFVQDIASKNEINASEVKKVADAVFNQLKTVMAKNQQVTIPNFGRFNLRTTTPRNINNLGGGGMCITTPKDKPMFQPSRKFISEINNISQDIDL